MRQLTYVRPNLLEWWDVPEPRLLTIKISPDKIGLLIGPGGNGAHAGTV